MLKGNLSTRPFYNERLVAIAIAGVALLVAVVTFFNTSRLVALSTHRTVLGRQIEEDRTEAARINTETAALQQNVDRVTLNQLATSTREANDLIAHRTFSWTAFFGLIERTLPLDVRLVAVSPRADRGVVHVKMSVIARQLDQIDEFTAALLESGGFKDVQPTEQQRREEDGLYHAVLDSTYVPSAAARSGGAPATPAQGNER